jgi:hypothetical protein
MKPKHTPPAERRRPAAFTLLVAHALTVPVAACSADETDEGAVVAEGTNTGNGATETFEVRLAALTPDAAAGGPLATTDAAGSPLTLDRARAAVREVRFQLPDGRTCDALPDGLVPVPWRCEPGDDWVRFDAPFVVDLLEPAAPEALASAPLPALGWRRAEVRFHEGRALVGPEDPLSNATLDLGGTLGRDGQGRRFSLAVAVSTRPMTPTTNPNSTPPASGASATMPRTS